MTSEVGRMDVGEARLLILGTEVAVIPNISMEAPNVTKLKQNGLIVFRQAS